MRMRTMLNSGILALVMAAGLGGCSEAGTGPSQPVTLRIEGTVTDVWGRSVGGAYVELRELRHVLGDATTLGVATTDSGGHYVVVSSAPCVPADSYWYWLEVSEPSYGSFSTRTTFGGGQSFDPVIRCTSSTQVIDVVL